MDRYAAELRDELWTTIDKMNEFRWLYVKDPMRDFTRRHKLPMDSMLKIMIQLQSKSLPHELGDYFSYKADMPTPSAFIQQRSKLADYALPALFSTFADAHPPRRMTNGYRLIACDGSDVILQQIRRNRIVTSSRRELRAIVWHISMFFRMQSEARTWMPLFRIATAKTRLMPHDQDA